MKIGRLLLRIIVGSLFIGHGTQKLFGWFSGHGLEATSQMFEQIGMRPGRRNAIGAGLAETGGGAGLVLGLATPLSASVLIATMLTAINRVHLKNGPWATNGGYEYNAVLIAAVATLADLGPGGLSLDAAAGRERSGPGWALAALILGGAGALGAHLLAESQPLPQEAASEEAAPVQDGASEERAPARDEASEQAAS
jgi:putative oxidoreductase